MTEDFQVAPIPYYIAYIFSKILYYLWTVPNYIIFFLRTIGSNKVINGVASVEATYVHIIENYTFASSIKNQKIIEKFLELSQDKDNLFNELLNDSIYKEALKSIISPLQDEYITTILNLMYPSTDNNNYKVKEIKSLIEKIKNNKKVEGDRNIIDYILEISKEIVAAHAWYHDSSDVIGAELPKLKNNNKIFYIRNIGNAGKFFSSFLYRSDGKFSFNNEEGKEYRKNYGNSGLQIFIFFINYNQLKQVV